MKVAVFGSMRMSSNPTLTTEELECFKYASRRIGFELAKRGHEIFIATLNEETADPHVFKGATDAVQKKDLVKIYRPNDPQKNKKVDEMISKIGCAGPPLLRKQTVRGSFARAHASAIQDADAVLVISGAEGADYAATIAELLGKPVLPVPTFGGTAHKLWQENSEALRSAIKNSGQHQLVFEEWESVKSPQNIVSALEILLKTQPSRKPIANNLPMLKSFVLLGVGAALLFLWFFLISLTESAFSPLQGLILIVSALMGTVFRVSVLATKPEPSLPEGAVIIGLAVAGTYAAFFIMILYFAGSRFLRDTNLSHIDPAEILTAAISMTIIGFLSAFQLEKAIRRISSVDMNPMPKEMKKMTGV